MPKKLVSKTSKKTKKSKERAWREKRIAWSKDHDAYYRRVILLDNRYLSEYDDGTIEVYCSIGIRPTLEYGFCYQLVLRGKHGTPIITKWVYPPKDMPLEDIWKEACSTVDEIANEGIIDKEYLKSRDFVWD